MPSRQWLWMQQQRKAGKCWCGREPKEGYVQCQRCLDRRNKNRPPLDTRKPSAVYSEGR